MCKHCGGSVMKTVVKLWRASAEFIGTCFLICGFALSGFLAVVYISDRITDAKEAHNRRKDKYYETCC
jgi:hypothetical protein